MFRDALKVMLDIQEFDIQMIRLMRLKTERQAELERVRALRDDLHHQVIVKESEIIEIKKQVRIIEGDITELTAKIQKLEIQQNSVRKVEEFNALTHEISALEREKGTKEQKLSDHYDKIVMEDDYLKSLRNTYSSSQENSQQIEDEIKDNIRAINQQGAELVASRVDMIKHADPEIMKIYEKLLKNKRDRVIVPIENRCCSGCHILITAQHENVVRKGEKIVFCEHCSRIHYWHDHLSTLDSNLSIEQTNNPKKRKKVAPVKL